MFDPNIFTQKMFSTNLPLIFCIKIIPQTIRFEGLFFYVEIIFYTYRTLY